MGLNTSTSYVSFKIFQKISILPWDNLGRKECWILQEIKKKIVSGSCEVPPSIENGRVEYDIPTTNAYGGSVFERGSPVNGRVPANTRAHTYCNWGYTNHGSGPGSCRNGGWNQWGINLCTGNYSILILQMSFSLWDSVEF